MSRRYRARLRRTCLGRLRLKIERRFNVRLEHVDRLRVRTGRSHSADLGEYEVREAEYRCRCGGDHRVDQVNWNGITRPVVFTFPSEEVNNTGVRLRVFQVAEMLQVFAPPVTVRIKSIENLYRSRPRGHIVIVQKAVKREWAWILRALKKRGNTLLFDMVDGLVPDYLEGLPDGYICSSLSEQLAREAKGQFAISSLQSPDQLIPTMTFDKRPFDVVYHGAKHNAQHLTDLPELRVLQSPLDGSPERMGAYLAETLPLLRRASHHYSVRRWNKSDGFKPKMKGFVAAALGAVIICSAENEESLLILGNDYPYLAKSSSLEDVKAIIDYARNTHLREEWHRAVATMQELRQMSCPVKTARDLVEGLRRLPH